jgi:hypothetical protein
VGDLGGMRFGVRFGMRCGMCCGMLVGSICSEEATKSPFELLKKIFVIFFIDL